MESRIQLRKFRILLKIEIHNPCSTEKDWNQESTTCNLESKTVLDSLTRGEIEALVSRTVVKLLVERSRFSTRLIYTDHRQLVSRTWITNGKMVLRLLWPCLVPRPHYYAPPMRFGSRGPRKFLRPRQTRWSETFCLSWGGVFGSGRAVSNFSALMKDVQQPWRVERIKRLTEHFYSLYVFIVESPFAFLFHLSH